MMQSLDAASIRKRALELLEMELSEDQAQKLSRFADLLMKWNASYNLTSITSPKDVLDLHLVDSLALAKCSGNLLDGRKTVLDVGSGGGLPAIPLAIVRPELEITMVDAVQKKTIFQRQAISMLRLKNIKAEHMRVEQIKDRTFDVITSRAFASLADMVHLTEHLLAPGGVWLAMKGKFPQEEVDSLPQDVSISTVFNVENMKVERHLIALKKNLSGT